MGEQFVNLFYKNYTEAAYISELLKEYNIENKIRKADIIKGRSCGYILSFEKRYKSLCKRIIYNDSIQKNNFINE